MTATPMNPSKDRPDGALVARATLAGALVASALVAAILRGQPRAPGLRHRARPLRGRQRLLAPSGSPTATRCGSGARRRGCTGGAAGRSSSRRAAPAQPAPARPRSPGTTSSRRTSSSAARRLRWAAHAGHLLGLRARRGGHLPALVRLDPLRDAGGLAGAVRGLRLRRPGLPLPARRARSRRWSSTCSTSRPCWCSLGICLAIWRRARDRGALAVQQLANDLLPLLLLFADLGHRPAPHRLDALAARLPLRLPLAVPRDHGDLHAALPAVREVLPHLPAAGAALASSSTAAQAQAGPQATCARCGERLRRARCTSTISRTSSAALHPLRAPAGAHYQDVCPPCRRKNLAVTQDGLWPRPPAPEKPS